MEPCFSCLYLTYCIEYVWKSSLSSVYFKEHNEHNDQEYYWPTIYRAGTAVVSTITSFYHLLDALERTKTNFKSEYKKNITEVKKNIFLINRYAIAKRNLKILRRNCENEQDYYSNFYIHLIYWKKWKEIIMKRHKIIIHVMKV